MAVVMHKKISFFNYYLLIIACILFQDAFTQMNDHQKTKNEIIPLEGIWKFKLDPFYVGINANGVQLMPQLPEEITLPGSTDEAGKGFKTQGMTSLRLTRSFEYKGAAWYEKQIFIPRKWNDKEVHLFLERAHWQTQVWINGIFAGKRESLSTSHVYDISSLVRAGEENTIRICVDNDLIYNIEYSHAISAETQTNWNGIIGKIELQAFEKIFIKDLQVYPDADKKILRVVSHISNPLKLQQNAKLGLVIGKKSEAVVSKEILFSGNDSILTVEASFPLGNDVSYWDEFHPTLYQLNAQLTSDAEEKVYRDVFSTNFGVRSASTKGTRFVINGRESFIRSTVNSAEFPLTGYPSMDKIFWFRVFTVCKNYGLNGMRFHSWCPPEAAFEAADEIGMYLQIENSDWRFTVGKDSAINKFLSEEADRILEAYGNHPSFVFFCEGNELVGPSVKSFLSGLVVHWKKKDPRHLYTGASGYPVISENDFNDFYGARPQRWKEGLKGRFNIAPLQTMYDYSDYVKQNEVPMITHEIGQWCAFPNFDEISKYTGVLKPYNYQLFRELLRNSKILDQAEQFTMASGKFQVIQKKEEIESYLRTPGFGGYSLLQLEDFPGQGTAPVGVVDIFWDSKPYVTAKEFHQFQSSQVLLLRTESFTWTNDQNFKATIEFANFGESVINNATVQWTLNFPDGKVYAEGNILNRDIPLGSPITIGNLNISLDKITEATRLDLAISIPGMNCNNYWSVWIYPKELPTIDMKKTLVSYQWDKKTKQHLQNGGRVLLLADTSKIISSADPVFSGISWNTVWSGMPPNLLGILCDSSHPALNYFPTENHSNWQWWDVVRHSKPVVLDFTSVSFKPLIQMIPDWNNPKKIGLVFEAKVGKGSLLFSAVDLRDQMDERPVARQLLYSLKKYIRSNEFGPSMELRVEDIDRIFKK
jgi:hypothetical protein